MEAKFTQENKKELDNSIEKLVMKKEFLPIIKHDIKPIRLNRKIIFHSNEEEKMNFYLIPLMLAFPGKVVYVSSKDVRKPYPKLREFHLYTAADLPFISDFEKIIISTDSIMRESSKKEVRKIFDFMNEKADSRTLVIIDEVESPLYEHMEELINHGPCICIIIFRNQEQLKESYSKTNRKLEKDLTNNLWAVINMSDFIK